MPKKKLTRPRKDPVKVAAGRIGGAAGRGKSKARSPEQCRAAGRIGGSAGRGKSKKRSSAQARAAVKVRWANYRKNQTQITTKAGRLM